MEIIPVDPDINNKLRNNFHTFLKEMYAYHGHAFPKKFDVQALDRESKYYCALLFQEIKLDNNFDYYTKDNILYEFGDEQITPYALEDYALVLTVCGVLQEWEQPFAFHLSSNATPPELLKEIIFNAVTELQKLGLNVVGTICEQDETNYSLMSALCADNHWFDVNGQRINCIYDVGDLIKKTRNALVENDIKFDGKIAKFEHILKFMKFNYPFNALTEKHFDFEDPVIKHSVIVACKQLGSQLAARMQYVSMHFKNVLPKEAAETCEFMRFMDQLYDSLNCSYENMHMHYKAKPLKCIVTNESAHMTFWSKAITDIKNWQIIDYFGDDVTDKFTFITGWQITILSVMEVWRKLNQQVGNGVYLCTNRLNHGLLEYEQLLY